MISDLSKVTELIEAAAHIVVVQADNPDGDSLASSLALESILELKGKKVTMFCGVDIPSYLKYMSGWDRIVNDLPNTFDLSIIVDTSSLSLLETLTKNGTLSWLKTKPCLIIDHHATEATIDFASATIIERAASTGEVIFRMTNALGWEIDVVAAENIAYSILSDTLGLVSESVTPDTMLTMSKLLEGGVVMAKLDEARRSMNRKSLEIVRYKGSLLARIAVAEDDRIATVHIPWDEIEKYSHAYNPSMLVIDEMRMTDNVQVAIAFKSYPDGKITAKIRSNYGYRIAGKLAEHFGGGGHDYASGFKIQNKRTVDDVRSECISVATKLLNELEDSDENL